MTCQEIADLKRSRKAMDEVKMLTEWEDSLSSVMKAARSGDIDRVTRLMASEGGSEMRGGYLVSRKGAF